MKVTYKELPEKAAEGYGITRWGNAQEIKQSLTDLTDKNIYSIPEEKYKEICSEYYDKKCRIYFRDYQSLESTFNSRADIFLLKRKK